jgi:transposase InsO family protein
MLLDALDHLSNLAAWLSRQVTEAFPWDTAPRYLLRDRDASYGSEFRCRVEAMEVITAPRSPWQNAYVERVIGSIRRECLDHIVIFNERHLRRVLSSYVDYYQRTRTHLSLDKDCPDSRRASRADRSKPSSVMRNSRPKSPLAWGATIRAGIRRLAQHYQGYRATEK